jgi:hypothetical protein
MFFFSFEMGCHELFLLGLAETVILLISSTWRWIGHQHDLTLRFIVRDRDLVSVFYIWISSFPSIALLVQDCCSYLGLFLLCVCCNINFRIFLV